VIATIALFLAIGGIGYAAATIGTNDIKNGAVTAPKIHKKAVSKKKLKKASVNSAKVKDHSLLEEDLAFNVGQGATGPQGPPGPPGPPGAAGGTSTNATTVNGLSVQKVFFKGGPNATVANRFAAGGLVLRLGCSSGDPVAEVFTTQQDIALQGDVSGIDDDDGTTYNFSAGINQGFEEDITGGTRIGSGRLTYSTSTGTVLTMLYGFDNSPTFNGEDVCTFRGTVIVG